MWVEVVLLVALLVLLKKALSKPEGLPPGRWGLPLFGYIPLLSRKNIQRQLKDLHKQHGDVYTWRMGTQVMIFLHDYQLSKEAFGKPEFTDRPDWILYTIREKPALGVGASNGVRWHNNRRFSLRQLRDLGMGKSKLVAAVQTQARRLVEGLKGQAGRPAPIPLALNSAILNVIWQMVASKQFDPSDPKLKEFQDIMDEFFLATSRLFIMDFFPWIDRVLPEFLLNWICKLEIVSRFNEKLTNYFMEVIDEHQSTLDRNNPRDLIDSYLIEEETRKDDPDSTFHERDLVMLIMDLFTAGSQTTLDTLKFTLYYLAANPRVQRKMQAEIDEVLGGALASLEDRPKMPYTEAVLHEVLRMSSLVTLGLQHVASKDTHLAGYSIPKGAILQSVTVSLHHDPRYWDNPHQFLPERWLDENGSLNTKKEGFLPFGVGKRQCLGEGLARMELLIFSTAILQNFSIASAPGKTIDVSADPDSPLFSIPITQEVLFTLRK